MKSSSFRTNILNHTFNLSGSTLQKPTKLWLNVYSIDPGLALTWDTPAAVFTPYEITNVTISGSTATINEEIRLGPVPAGQTYPISNFVIFAQYGTATPTYEPLHIGFFRTTRTVPEGDYLLFPTGSIVITEE